MKDKIRLYFINKYLVSMHDQFLMEITKKQNVFYNANMIAKNLILLQLLHDRFNFMTALEQK